MGNTRNNVFILTILGIVFFAIRFTTYPHVFTNDILNLIDPDSYYHLRRVLYTISNYPKLLNFDPFLSYPHGDFSPWPPFYDFISATIIKLLGGNIKIIPFLNPLYFFVAFTLIYLALLKRHGITPAIITAIFLSITGILYLYTSFGRFDHHALELLILTLVYLTFTLYWEKKRISFLLLFSFFSMISFFNWPGALIYFIPLFFFTFYELYNKRLDSRILKGLFVAFHISAISIAIYLKITKTDSFPPYSYKFLSGFHRDIIFFVSIIFITLYFHKTTRINKILLWTFNIILAALIFHKLFYEIFKGFMFVIKGDKLMILIEESSPLFFSNFYSISEELKRAISLFTPFLFISPIVFYQYFKKKGGDVIFFYSLFFFILTLFQLRFGYFFMLGYSVLLGVVLREFLERQIRFVFIVFLIISALLVYRDFRYSSERFIDRELQDGLIFLRDNTPDKEEFLIGKTPYGILGSWHLGHYIIEIGKRPAVAHNFINVAINNGEREFIKALFSQREEEIISIMEKNRARFIFLDNPDDLIITDWYAINQGKNPYTDNHKTLNSRVSELFLFNLYHFDGIIPPFTKSLNNIRLVYETSGAKNKVKIFEKVRGAKIIYQGSKNPVVKALIKTPHRSFFYINRGEEEENKKIFSIPYSVDSPYPVRASYIHIELDGKKIPIEIKEKEVMEGTKFEEHFY